MLQHTCMVNSRLVLHHEMYIIASIIVPIMLVPFRVILLLYYVHGCMAIVLGHAVSSNFLKDQECASLGVSTYFVHEECGCATLHSCMYFPQFPTSAELLNECMHA